MRMEMEGREPLIIIFGVPLLTTGIVLVSMHLGQMRTEIVPLPPIQVQAPQVTITPHLTAELPAGAIQTTVHVPPAQIHEVIREVVKIPEVNVINQVPEAPAPSIQVHLPEQPATRTQIVVVPTPVPMPVPTPVSLEPPLGENPDGKLLPPPKPPDSGPPSGPPKR